MQTILTAVKYIFEKIDKKITLEHMYENKSRLFWRLHLHLIFYLLKIHGVLIVG